MSKRRSKYTVEMEYNDVPVDMESLPWQAIRERRPAEILAVVLSAGKIKLTVRDGEGMISQTVSGEMCLVMHRSGYVSLCDKKELRRQFNFTEDACGEWG